MRNLAQLVRLNIYTRTEYVRTLYYILYHMVSHTEPFKEPFSIAARRLISTNNLDHLRNNIDRLIQEKVYE